MTPTPSPSPRIARLVADLPGALAWYHAHPYLGLWVGMAAAAAWLAWQIARLAQRAPKTHGSAWRHPLYAWRRSRQFNLAMSKAFPRPEDRPRAIGANRVAVGDRLTVSLPHGKHLGSYQAEAIGSALRTPVRLERGLHPGQLHAIVVRKELAEAGIWPGATLESTRFTDPIPVGIDQDGREVTLSLAWRNLLIGGLMDAGKSVALSLIVAWAALDPSVDLWLFDPKLVELHIWEPCAKVHVEDDMAAAINALKRLHHEMDARFRTLKRGPFQRKVKLSGSTRLIVVVIDEKAEYTANPDKRLAAEFTALERRLVSKGRAAGIVVVSATQRPSHTIIPTDLRELFAYRWALRSATPTSSDMILGDGKASGGYDASEIDDAHPGEGYLFTTGGKPKRFRAYNLPDPELQVLAARAYKLRETSRQNDIQDPQVDKSILSLHNACSDGQKAEADGTVQNGNEMIEGFGGEWMADSGRERRLNALPERDKAILRRLADGPLRQQTITTEFYGEDQAFASRRLRRMASLGLIVSERADPEKGGASPKVWKLQP